MLRVFARFGVCAWCDTVAAVCMVVWRVDCLVEQVWLAWLCVFVVCACVLCCVVWFGVCLS